MMDKIFYPDSTDLTRRGLGLKVGVRGFQWSNVQSEDLIFWHYDITNESSTSYPKMIFGMYVDCGIGGQYDSNDDNASLTLKMILPIPGIAMDWGRGAGDLLAGVVMHFWKARVIHTIGSMMMEMAKREVRE